MASCRRPLAGRARPWLWASSPRPGGSLPAAGPGPRRWARKCHSRGSLFLVRPAQDDRATQCGIRHRCEPPLRSDERRNPESPLVGASPSGDAWRTPLSLPIDHHGGHHLSSRYGETCHGGRRASLRHSTPRSTPRIGGPRNPLGTAGQAPLRAGAWDEVPREESSLIPPFCERGRIGALRSARQLRVRGLWRHEGAFGVRDPGPGGDSQGRGHPLVPPPPLGGGARLAEGLRQLEPP